MYGRMHVAMNRRVWYGLNSTLQYGAACMHVCVHGTAWPVLVFTHIINPNALNVMCAYVRP